MGRNISKFYKQLFDSWNKTKEGPKDDPFKLRREVIWLNKDIKIEHKEVCYRNWYQSGIVMFHDLLKEDGNLKSIEELEREFGINILVMEYNSLITAIPASWKRAVKQMKIPAQAISNQEQPYVTCNNRLMALDIVTNRDVYWELVTKKQIKPICANKWCTLFDIEQEDWKEIYKTFANIRDTRTKAFQFKILNNLIPCNLYLKRISKSDTDMCPKCNILDDQMHYLVECPEVALIWTHLSRWWKGLTEQDLVLTGRDIILGIEQRPFKLEMKTQLDDIILATKWRIYANKQMGEDIGFYQVLCSIRSMINIQKLIASRRDISGKHDIIWGQIEDYLT
jgi:hypothetical protein